MSRKRSKQQKRAGQGGAVPSLSCIEPHAAGIDVGAREIFVAVPQDRDPSPVRSFDTFTEDLHRLKEWLQQCGIRTVALESTGVYWIPLFQILAAPPAGAGLNNPVTFSDASGIVPANATAATTLFSFVLMPLD